MCISKGGNGNPPLTELAEYVCIQLPDASAPGSEGTNTWISLLVLNNPIALSHGACSFQELSLNVSKMKGATYCL